MSGGNSSTSSTSAVPCTSTAGGSASPEPRRVRVQQRHLRVPPRVVGLDRERDRDGAHDPAGRLVEVGDRGPRERLALPVDRGDLRGEGHGGSSRRPSSGRADAITDPVDGRRGSRSATTSATRAGQRAGDARATRSPPTRPGPSGRPGGPTARPSIATSATACATSGARIAERRRSSGDPDRQDPRQAEHRARCTRAESVGEVPGPGTATNASGTRVQQRPRGPSPRRRRRASRPVDATRDQGASDGPGPGSRRRFDHQAATTSGGATT